MSYRITVDVGGTFTDVLLTDGAGRVRGGLAGSVGDGGLAVDPEATAVLRRE